VKKCCIRFDFDALSVWFGYPNTTPAMLARGKYGARVGVPRVLDLLRIQHLPATFFIPGHRIDSFPHAIASILEADHEVAHHSYAHVDPSTQTLDKERRDLERGLDALQRIGVQPLGFRSPARYLPTATLGLLETYDFRYDSSLMADDFRPYRPRIGERVSQQEPLIQGRPAQLWELPISFEFDDWMHFPFNFNPYRNGTAAPSKVLEIWIAELDWMHIHVDGGVLTVVMHPQAIGRGHRIAMLEQFITHCRQHRDVTFARLGDVVTRLGQPTP
jgi:peptidoglycan/xylan/chitin deacetylase (PgdA/CDA1 family)